MERLFVLLFLLASITAVILYKKFPGNTKKGILVRFCWFTIVMTLSFIFLCKNASIPQNLVLGAFAVGGLFYFFYKFKSFRQQANH
jgi:uncharacterized membrane protein YqgA involved in biofilm formation